ncbi:hypothetical protein [Teichococcus wenyumeiae]|uniref:hypothetical protein n=1 Tax=Teichococcus wenyumeiae TaxID=2478470 RepID=UPI0018F2E198|nr:hypothetical protein [Pseudoroseomonas wenyumeiae]
MSDNTKLTQLSEEDLNQVSGGNGTTGLTGVNQMNLQNMDLETALMTVQSERVRLLDSQLQAQIEGVQARNDAVAHANGELGQLNAVASKFGSDASAHTSIALETKVSVGDRESTVGEILKGLSRGEDILKDGRVEKGEIDAAIVSTKGHIHSLSNSQQMDMLRLQSLSNKRNEAFDVMTNFVKKMQESRASIIGNMR